MMFLKDCTPEEREALQKFQVDGFGPVYYNQDVVGLRLTDKGEMFLAGFRSREPGPVPLLDPEITDIITAGIAWRDASKNHGICFVSPTAAPLLNSMKDAIDRYSPPKPDINQLKSAMDEAAAHHLQQLMDDPFIEDHGIKEYIATRNAYEAACWAEVMSDVN